MFINKKNTKTLVIAAVAIALLAACTKSEPVTPTPDSSLVPPTGQEMPVEGQPSNVPSATAPGTSPDAALNGAPQAGGMAEAGVPAAPSLPVEPYRTFITLEGFVMENNGVPENPISNVKLELTFPSGQKMELPGNGQFWTIGNGQVQEIKQTFELPWSNIQHDGFNFTVQMVRKGSDILPCKFDVRQLSQFNRKYLCHTDVAWQLNNKIPENQIEKEGIEVRVFTDKNTPAKEVPKDALAFR